MSVQISALSPYQPGPDRAPTLGSEPSVYLGRTIA